MTSEQSYPSQSQSTRDALVPRQSDPLGAPVYYPDYSYSNYYGSQQADAVGQGAGGGFGALWQAARRRWWIVLGVASVVTAGAWWYSLQLQAIYSSRFLMLVNVSSDRTRADSDIPIEKQKQLGFSTLIQVLRSSLILNQVVADLKDQHPDLNLGDLAENLNISLARDTDVLIVTYQNNDPERVKAVLDRVGAAYLEYGTTQARVNVQQGIDFVEGKLPELRARVERLREQVKDFRQTYKIYNPDARGGQLASEIASIQQRQEMLQIDLTAAQSTYERLQEQLGYQADTTTPQTAIVTAAVSQSPLYQQRLTELQAIETEIRQESQRFSANSPMIRSLEEERKQLETLLEEAEQDAVRGRPSEGTTTPLTGIDLDFNQQLIETTNQIAQLRVQEKELTRLKAETEEQFKAFPSISNEYLALQQELGRANESLNNFLNAQEQYSLQASQDSIPWQLITPASLPIKPISPDIPRQMALGVAAGLALGVGLALLVEKSDNVYHSPETMREGVQLPLLGTIPLYKALRDAAPTSPAGLPSGRDDGRLLTGDSDGDAVDPATNLATASPKGRQPRYNLSPFLEAFRSLNTNLNFLGTNKPLRAVTISSAAPGDGKSTVATYLAQAAAAMGQRVLLVDADLRRPQVHSIMGLENKRGFSDAIGREFPLRDAIQQSPWEKNLFVLPSGRIPPDPTRLLSSRKAQRIMDKLQSVFDLVIYDAPPLLGIADSTILSKRTDGIVLVIGMDKTNRNAVSEAFTNLR
ncbi:MAG: polysaccharide biosynthesis tyrosine autokinase, partial [Cyanobacteria bacterium J06642_2]